MVALQDSHFALFGLPGRFALDAAALDRAYRAVQAQVHPDRFATAGDAQKRVAMQWATRANEAYQTLRDPLRRAVYLLQLRGIDASAHDAAPLAGAFLIQQMTWRERIEEAVAAKNVAALDALAATLRADERARLTRLAALLDGDDAGNSANDGANEGESGGNGNVNDASANQTAATLVRELMFVEKVASEARAQAERLEGSTGAFAL